ncbi:MAG: TonB-dependent receptor [Neisseria sp.]|nr:TonB-dependent receptor [Neisseria sp.]
MFSHTFSISRLSVLSLALAAGFAQADGQSAQLETVHVHGEGVSSVERINYRSMSETTDSDLKDVLKDEVAIQFGGGNGVSQWATIRGMGQDQIDFRVDSTYTDSQVFHHQGRFMLDPALVKIIGVQKGTGSASAGIGATSGAIEATTVDAQDLLSDGKNYGFRVGAGVSSNAGWDRNLALYGKAGGWDGLVVGNWVTDRAYKSGNGEKIANSGLNQRGFLGKIGYNFNEDNRIVLSHRQEEQHGLRNLREEFVLFDRNQPLYRQIIQDTTNVQYSGKNLGKAVSTADANLYRLNQRVKLRGQTHDITTIGSNIGLSSLLANRHTVKYGINWRKQNAKPDESTIVTPAKEQKIDYGVYVEGIWDIHPVTVTTGLRYDHFDMRTSGGNKVSDGSLNPSIGMIWEVNDQLSFNAGWNQATRSPRLYEAQLTGARTIVSDGSLKAETSRKAEVGFKWNVHHFALSGSYFYQTIKDVQAFESLGGNTYRHVNAGKLTNKGYELNAAYHYRGLTGRVGVAYSDPQLEGGTADTITTFVPVGRTWLTSLSYRFERPALEVGWRGRYVQKSQSVPSRGSGGGATTPMPGYGVHDVFANWKPTGKDNLNVNFSVNNVGNKQYKSHSQRVGANSLPEVGREFRLAMNYRF